MTNGQDSAEFKLSQWAASRPVAPSDVAVDRANDALFDGLICMIAGSADETVRIVFEGAQKTHGTGSCKVIGTDMKLPPASAALVNGTAAHALEFDDNFLPGMTHASAILAPALFALGQIMPVSGQDILNAYIVGLELHARIGAAVNPNHYASGWHATSTVGTIGTAGACAMLMGLDARQINNAMSLGFSLASGTRLQFGTKAKPTHAGFGAHNAVLAAFMAQSGLDGQSAFVTGQWGFRDLYQGNPVPGAEHRMLDDIGERWAIVEDGLFTKRFPCCASAHFSLDGVEMLRRDHGLRLRNLKSLTAYLPNPQFQNLRFDAPTKASEARFSMSYPALRLLQNGKVSLRDFTDEAVAEPLVQASLYKIKRSQTSPASVTAPVVVEAEFTDGRTVEVTVSSLVGSPAKPLSPGQLHTKARDCLSWAGMGDKKEWVDQFRNLVRIGRFADLFARY
ncbi:MmgE/PrpD family protein [Microbulbifer sp. VAAF005]|uniref:MmgE/PrpD family protein n=1 Tax=Microbulbifer sp. VAAF005 TaxID=3034230 RepID=UPI0024ACC629|nr:MmgE/PrpD family protein [Microbulbifer sp. VAAF005]WHI45836.1 MmgE/PrpD family protein [Microbulbifer sp. VAAF005]